METKKRQKIFKTETGTEKKMKQSSLNSVQKKETETKKKRKDVVYDDDTSDSSSDEEQVTNSIKFLLGNVFLVLAFKILKWFDFFRIGH